jgi:HSP20 family protein
MPNRFLDLFNPPGGAGGSDPFSTMQREFDRMLGDWRRGGGEGFDPLMDVHEADGAVQVTAELPGLSPEDVTVEVRGDVLSIRGEKKAESETKDEKTGAVHRERRYGAFHRAVRLPFRADADKASASFENGVLKLTVPAAENQPDAPRRISIG